MGVLICMKYMMFLFNGLIFIGNLKMLHPSHVCPCWEYTLFSGISIPLLCTAYLVHTYWIGSLLGTFPVGGICLLGIGIWVVADPDGFQSIVISSPLLSTAGYILLIVGLALSLLGFLGCFGAIRENKPLLLLFFVLILLFFTVELVGVILALTYQKMIREEHFLTELQQYYKGDNSTEVLTQSWNTIMIALSCCGISGVSDFGNRSHFHDMYPSAPWPDACCQRDDPVLSGNILDREKCMQNTPGFTNTQGCFITIARSLKKYISITGAVGLVVLGIEMFAMFLALCLYYNFD